VDFLTACSCFLLDGGGDGEGEDELRESRDNIVADIEVEPTWLNLHDEVGIFPCLAWLE
jgi:hypothetical protein